MINNVMNVAFFDVYTSVIFHGAFRIFFRPVLIAMHLIQHGPRLLMGFFCASIALQFIDHLVFI